MNREKELVILFEWHEHFVLKFETFASFDWYFYLKIPSELCCKMFNTAMNAENIPMCHSVNQALFSKCISCPVCKCILLCYLLNGLYLPTPACGVTTSIRVVNTWNIHILLNKTSPQDAYTETARFKTAVSFLYHSF